MRVALGPFRKKDGVNTPSCLALKILQAQTISEYRPIPLLQTRSITIGQLYIEMKVGL